MANPVFIGGLLLLVLAIALARDLRRGARHGHFLVVTEVILGLSFMAAGLMRERLEWAQGKLGWIVVALVVVLAARQVTGVVRAHEARGRTEGARLREHLRRP